MIDVIAQIDNVQRVVGTVDASQTRVATITQAYDTTADDLWDACTNPDRIPRWFLPISGDLRVGAHYQLEGNAGGTIEACNRPDSFAATWEFGGAVSRIEVRLSVQPDGRTLLTLEHTADVADDLWAQFGPGAVGIGWDMAFMGLAGHLYSGAAVDPASAMTWMVSDEGRKFMALSSDRWCEANIVAGTDVAAARAAADRTTAAYTAPPGE